MGDVFYLRPRSALDECLWLAEAGAGMDGIAQAQTEHPTLTWDGFWVPWCPVITPRIKSFQAQRARMLSRDALEEFHFAAAFLATCPRRKAVSYRFGTGALKHVAEAWWRERHGRGVYISRGMLIAAAVASGIVCRRIPDAANARLGLADYCGNLSAVLRRLDLQKLGGAA